MTTIRARAWRNAGITAVAALALVVVHVVYDAAFRRPEFLSGWLLLAALLLLTLYNGRKKIMILALGSNSAWLQVHIYTGWLAIVLFVIHIGWRVPNGGLELTLAIAFVLVAGSGVVGIALARSLPKRLTRRGEEVIFERIPVFLRRLRDEAERTAEASAAETGSSTVADYYLTHLAQFFEGPRNVVRHLLGSPRGTFALLQRIDNMERYLNPEEQAYSQRLRGLVLQKDELDYHYALQAALKIWLFVHVPVTFALLVLAVLHLVLVYAFSGGL